MRYVIILLVCLTLGCITPLPSVTPTTLLARPRETTVTSSSTTSTTTVNVSVTTISLKNLIIRLPEGEYLCPYKVDGKTVMVQDLTDCPTTSTTLSEPKKYYCGGNADCVGGASCCAPTECVNNQWDDWFMGAYCSIRTCPAVCSPCPTCECVDSTCVTKEWKDPITDGVCC